MRNLLIAGVFFIAACLAQTGMVKSEGQPIPGATVKATQGNRILLTLTGNNGSFQFDSMPPGAWIVEVDMFGFDHARKEVQIASTSTKIDFTLQLRDRARGPAQANAEAALDTQMNAAGAEAVPAPQVAAEASNDSLLVNGSVSQGLQTQASDLRPDEMRPGGFGPEGLGGVDGVDNPGGPGGRSGPGGNGPGFRGGPGGAGGLNGGRGGFGGGPGGRGGRFEGRGNPRDRNGNAAFIGNRRGGNNNRITGSLFYSLQNSALNARPFSVNGLSAPKAAYARNNFGFSAGGPLVIPKVLNLDKTTWFLNYTGTLSRLGVDNALTEPTLLERIGDFSQSRAIIYHPATNLPFAGNRIPADQISSAARGLLTYLPQPNQPGVTRQNFRFITANPNHAQNLNTRLNTSLTQKDTLGFTFNLQERNNRTHQYFGCCDQGDGQGMNVNLNWRHRFGVRSFQTLTANFNRNTNSATPFFAFGADVAAQLGIQGTSRDPRNYGPPALSFTNFNGLNDGVVSHSAVENFGLNEAVSIRKGKHNLSFGGGFTHYLNNGITDPNGRGSFSFSGLSTAAFDARGLPLNGTGYDFADFLLGLPETSSIRYGDSSTYFRTNSYNAFGVDDWRVRNNLTLNLGLRYEYFAPWHEKYGHIANLDIAPGFSAVAPVTPGASGPYSGVFPAALIHPDRNNFGPRTALAWKPRATGRTMVRLGYGWYYNPSQYNQFMNRLAAQPPFALTNSVTTSSADILTLGTGLIAVPPGKTVRNTYAVALDYRDMYAQTWTVSIQTDLPKALVMEVGYTGTKGTRLDVAQAPNQAPLGSSLTAEQRQPIVNAGNFTFDNPVGNSISHAGQLRLTRRFQRGLSANLQYTYSRAIDDAVLAQNFYDQSAERALSSNNHSHLVNFNWVWASPVDATKGFLSHPVWVAKALKDWSVSGTLQAQTGSPLTALIAGNRAGTASLGPLRANATGESVDAGTGYFNLAAFTVPPPGQYGNAGRNTIIGPGSWVMNLSLSRSVNLHSERRRVEFRLDATNFLNHVNPAGLVTIVNSSQYGLITSAGAMRSLSATVRLRF